MSNSNLDGSNSPIPSHHSSHSSLPLEQSNPPPRTPSPRISASLITDSTTPQSQHCSSYQDAVANKNKVPDINFYLQVDINTQRGNVSIEKFSRIALDLDLGKADKVNIPDAVQKKLAAYLDRMEKPATKEVDLYKPFLELLDAIKDAIGDEADNNDSKAFYRQDPYPVKGSLVSQKPDFGMLYALLVIHDQRRIETVMKEDEKCRIHYGMVLSFKEVKHTGGHLVGAPNCA